MFMLLRVFCVCLRALARRACDFTHAIKCVRVLRVRCLIPRLRRVRACNLDVISDTPPSAAIEQVAHRRSPAILRCVHACGS